MSRIAIVLPANPIGYNEVEGSGNDEDGKVFVVVVFCKSMQHPDACYRVEGADQDAITCHDEKDDTE